MPSRSRYQKGVRKEHVKFILDNMLRKLRTKKEQKRIVTTNRILPVGTLKRRAVKRIFAGWICELYGQGRILTATLAKEVCRSLRKKMGLVNHNVEVEEEAQRLHVLLKRARKRQIHLLAGKFEAMSSMDNLTTVPMLHELDLEDSWSLKSKTLCWGTAFRTREVDRTQTQHTILYIRKSLSNFIKPGPSQSDFRFFSMKPAPM